MQPLLDLRLELLAHARQLRLEGRPRADLLAAVRLGAPLELRAVLDLEPRLRGQHVLHPLRVLARVRLRPALHLLPLARLRLQKVPHPPELRLRRALLRLLFQGALPAAPAHEGRRPRAERAERTLLLRGGRAPRRGDVRGGTRCCRRSAAAGDAAPDVLREELERLWGAAPLRLEVPRAGLQALHLRAEGALCVRVLLHAPLVLLLQAHLLRHRVADALLVLRDGVLRGAEVRPHPGDAAGDLVLLLRERLKLRLQRLAPQALLLEQRLRALHLALRVRWAAARGVRGLRSVQRAQLELLLREGALRFAQLRDGPLEEAQAHVAVRLGVLHAPLELAAVLSAHLELLADALQLELVLLLLPLHPRVLLVALLLQVLPRLAHLLEGGLHLLRRLAPRLPHLLHLRAEDLILAREDVRARGRLLQVAAQRVRLRARREEVRVIAVAALPLEEVPVRVLADAERRNARPRRSARGRVAPRAPEERPEQGGRPDHAATRRARAARRVSRGTARCERRRAAAGASRGATGGFLPYGATPLKPAAIKVRGRSPMRVPPGYRDQSRGRPLALPTAGFNCSRIRLWGGGTGWTRPRHR